LLIASIVGVTSLATLRRSLGAELDHLREWSAVGNGLVTAVFEEIRAAHEYLDDGTKQAADQFQSAADAASRYQKQLDGLPGLTEADRITVNRIKQLQAIIHVDYSLAHANVDLGRPSAAAAAAALVREPVTELTREVRALSTRQADRASVAGERLARIAREREILLWLVLLTTIVVGAVVGAFTLRSVEGPLMRLVTASVVKWATAFSPTTSNTGGSDRSQTKGSRHSSKMAE